jgi:hypothetical protein
VIQAVLPLAKMFGYVTRLRGLAQGWGRFTIELVLLVIVILSIAETASIGILLDPCLTTTHRQPPITWRHWAPLAKKGR